MPKCIRLTKYYHDCSRLQSGSFRNNVYPKTCASAGDGGGRPNHPGRPPNPPPPYPKGLVIGVCGLGSPRVVLLNHIHDDELAAVAGTVFCGAPPVLEALQERYPFYFKEEFGNRFVEFKGEFYETVHYGYINLPNGSMQLMPAPSYCYILRRRWLAEILGMLMSYDYGYVDESARAYEILREFRAKRLTPLYHWQSRLHMNVGPTITARDLPDGYLLDNRKQYSHKTNVIPKCVPSLLDVKENPEVHRDNPYKHYL